MDQEEKYRLAIKHLATDTSRLDIDPLLIKTLENPKNNRQIRKTLDAISRQVAYQFLNKKLPSS